MEIWVSVVYRYEFEKKFACYLKAASFQSCISMAAIKLAANISGIKRTPLCDQLMNIRIEDG